MSKELNKAPVEQAGGDERALQAEGAQEIPSPVSQEYDRHLISLLRKGEALPGHQEEAADEIERLRDWNDHLNNTVLPNILNPNFLMLMKGGERLLDLCTKDGKFIGVSLNDMKDVFDWMVTHARIAPDHAALAQPSPVSEPLIYACKSLAQITSSDGRGHADIALAVLRMAGVGKDERERLVNEWMAARAWKPSPKCATCNGTGLIDDGEITCSEGGIPYENGPVKCVKDCPDCKAQPSQAQAEAERPEMSPERAAYFMRRFKAEEKMLGPNEQAAVDYVLSLIAQHERIVGELRDELESERITAQFHDALDECDGDRWKLRSERDAALARVAELEKREPAGVPMPDEIHQMAFEEGQPADDGDGYLFSSEEFDLFVQRLLDSCAAPPAQAQHSVPEGVTIERDVVGTIHIKVGDFDFIQLQYQRPYTDNASTWKLAERIASLLAAAPGKEVGHE